MASTQSTASFHPDERLALDSTSFEEMTGISDVAGVLTVAERV
jgi:hypothetical protein